jgi:predicted histidine transporter YuiF (NhaC family)
MVVFLFFLLIIVFPILIVYLINKIFFSSKKLSNTSYTWSVVLLVTAIIIYGLYEFNSGAEEAILKGIIGLSFYCAFVYGVFKYFTFDEKVRTEIRLKFIITLIILVLIGFSFCSSEGLV